MTSDSPLTDCRNSQSNGKFSDLQVLIRRVCVSSESVKKTPQKKTVQRQCTDGAPVKMVRYDQRRSEDERDSSV